MNIIFAKKSFFFELSKPIKSSIKEIKFKKGWIIKLKNEFESEGFGEISPIQFKDFEICQKEISQIPEIINEKKLSLIIKYFHPCVQSGINSALAEINEKIIFKDQYPFQEIYQTAILLDSKSVIKQLKIFKDNYDLKEKKITFKWKVAIKDNQIEEKVLEQILSELTPNIKIRIDANGSWDRDTANKWADILKNNKNLDWLEQPLSKDDIKGMEEINKKIPVALDESLMKYPKLIDSWRGWQIRRPSQESNPMKLYEELKNKKGFISISSSFETGIGRRMLYHLSDLQLMGPTPKVPGLALMQMPKSNLFLNRGKLIWERL